jgi:adenosine deaminase
MDDKALTALTRTAIEAAFVDQKTKAALLVRLGR